MPESSTDGDQQAGQKSAWQIAKLICLGVVVVSVLSCVALAAARSTGLTAITVTAFDAKAEPADHKIPLFKRKDALPDYEVIVTLHSGEQLRLGAKPNTSAIDGLTWTLNDPVPVSDVASVRLQDQDKVVSDAIAEVQVLGESTSIGNYRFDFKTERSTSVGVKSFFRTPVGMAIAAAFFVAILVMLLGAIG